MKVPGFRAITGVFLAAMLSVPMLAQDANSKTAVPGTLNYVEGQASIDDQSLNSKSIGSAQLEPSQTLTTENGKAEILLTPGVFLRVGSNSAVKMISPSLTNTDVALEKGNAIVEVDQIHPENDIQISADNANTTLLKTGLYAFNADQPELRVFDGKASVVENDQHATVKGGHELSLNASGKLKTQKFDKKAYEESDLYRWSSLRSAYVAEANVNAARIYVDEGWGPWGPGWWGAGWYWNPWFSAYTFIPGDGIFYSPFGWGFYSPWLVYRAPLYFHGYSYGPGVAYYHHFSTNPHTWGPGPNYAEGANYSHGIYRGPGSTGSGFHSGPRMSAGVPRVDGGFHGGTAASGFHAGGFQAGGFHGAVAGGGFHR
jgi:hypothetical protein